MNFNERIAAYFLKNTRLTVLSLIMLIGFAGISTSFLKTTGFPSPEVNFAIVQTAYLGASSETVEEEITTPLEGAIKNVDGVKSSSSQSMNSFSMISLTLDEAKDQSKIISDLNEAISGVELPESTEEPKILTPDIAGPDFMFSVTGNSLPEIYKNYQEVEKIIYGISETSKVEPLNPLKQEVVIRLNQEKMTSLEIEKQSVLQNIQSLGESFPIASEIIVDEEQSSLVTSIGGDDLESLKNLVIGGHPLKEFATVSLRYEFENGGDPVIVYDGEILNAITFSVYTIENADLSHYTENLFEELADLDGNIQLIENYSIDDQNKQQVGEIMAGLFGAPFHTESVLKNLGYLLGGVQLVFLVMFLFVSFRAAVVASLSIPLSLVFSNIYLFLSGNHLNTLVLFSLVLVIGLVVDPALVIMESIQRKMDAGHKGKAAALEAVKDVGNGLFLATVTNLIVFFPFAVVSGILGQIIQYIPMTVIPAIIGSYIVPLIFLAWIGSWLLKAKKNATNNEFENLWGISKAFYRFNRALLNGPLLLRIFIVVIFLAGPLALTGFYFSSGKIKSVQFASTEDSGYIMISGNFFPNNTVEDKSLLTRSVLSTAAKETGIEQISAFAPEGADFTYFVTLKSIDDRDGRTTTEIADSLNEALQERYGKLFYDLQAASLANGPPTGAYQVALAIHSDDLDLLKDTSLNLGETLSNVCMVNDEISIDESCAKENLLVEKVNDGYTNQSSSVIEVLLYRSKLEEKNLILPNAPMSAFVAQTLNQVYGEPEKISTVSVKGEDAEVILEMQGTKVPKTLDEIRDYELISLTGESVALKEVASVKKTEPKHAIQHVNGETISLVQARLKADHSDQATSALVTQAVLDHYENSELEITLYSEGDLASFTKSFQELFMALLLSIALTYIVLALFFESFALPFIILYTIPITFLGVFPALTTWSGGEFGFLEIIGLIILVGLVENVAIFLIDLARQKMAGGMDPKEAIAQASAIRFRPVLLTKLTAVASLAPLAVLSDQYRSLALVIIFGLISSGIPSLITTPILFSFFQRKKAKKKD